MANYYLNGRRINLANFLEVNDLSEKEVAAVKALKPGGRMVFGGGAFATSILKCVAAGRQVGAEAPAPKGKRYVVNYSFLLDMDGPLTRLFLSEVAGALNREVSYGSTSSRDKVEERLTIFVGSAAEARGVANQVTTLAPRLMAKVLKVHRDNVLERHRTTQARVESF